MDSLRGVPAALPPGTFRTIVVLLRMYPKKTVVVVLLLLGSGFAEALGMLSILPLLSIAEGGADSSGSLGEIVEAILGRFGVRPTLGSLTVTVVMGLTVKAALLMVALRRAGYAAVDVATDLRLALVRNFMRARWSFFTGRSVGSITNAISAEAIRAGSVYSETCLMLAALIQAAIYAILLVFVSWYLLVIGSVVGVVLFFSFRRLIELSARGGRSETDSFISLTSRFADVVSAIKPLKAMGRQEAAQALIEEDVNQVNEAQRQLAYGRITLNAFQEPLIGAIIGVGLFLAIRRLDLPLERLIFMAIMLQRAITRLANAQSYFQSVAGLESSFWSLRSLISQASTSAEGSGGSTPPRLENQVTLEKVTFAYDSEAVLRDLTLVIPARRITAVIGPSGVGKTTLVDLISGLHRPTEGEVLIDGVPLGELNLLQWRNMIGYVPQEMVLLHDSVFHNVSMRDPGTSQEDVEQALRSAEAWDFVVRMPNGYDTVVGERGIRLSGGQRQRLSLARALVNRPSLLILDEPTTALDPHTEASIFETLRHLREEITILAISHQGSLIEAADVVYQLMPPPLGALDHPTQVLRAK